MSFHPSPQNIHDTYPWCFTNQKLKSSPQMKIEIESLWSVKVNYQGVPSKFWKIDSKVTCRTTHWHGSKRLWRFRPFQTSLITSKSCSVSLWFSIGFPPFFVEHVHHSQWKLVLENFFQIFQFQELERSECSSGVADNCSNSGTSPNATTWSYPDVRLTVLFRSVSQWGVDKGISYRKT